ncbi:serine hydrolase [Tsukamurella sp. 8F]|uniref:serine hydrolase domain-containing protein n=1 Tax=unclassified Tsukamurella TaxID=2633480 RepID=UPI0023BA0AB3|nr:MULTISPECIES: serine hydrolase domain-containing protein [unclassified Tsukamurella]MDF0528709.1 serine hydrolase [Tsukamurella sp. 8J]MDF0585671.1 serine hydrolase [Tsukamurella sp. 8F]
MTHHLTDRSPSVELDVDHLERAATAVCAAGIPGVFTEVVAGESIWRGASGVADIDTGAPVVPEMRHRVGSVSKTFVATAVLLLAEHGHVDLDEPIGHYLPRLVPGERGRCITPRMLLNHTSGLAEYLPVAYPSLARFPVLADTSPRSLEDNRFAVFDQADLIAMGVQAPPSGSPGSAPGRYSNTNYLLLCRLIELITDSVAERFVQETVIRPVGLRDTGFPNGVEIEGPHSRLYESWFGMLDPSRDYSVFDMSWVGPAASLISTTSDLDRFYRSLLAGEIVGEASLAQMQRTTPVVSFEGTVIDYGLGLHRKEVAGQGTFWGHDGSVWGGGTITMTRSDCARQMTVMINRQRWSQLDSKGRPMPDQIDRALDSLYRTAYGASE